MVLWKQNTIYMEWPFRFSNTHINWNHNEAHVQKYTGALCIVIVFMVESGNQTKMDAVIRVWIEEKIHNLMEKVLPNVTPKKLFLGRRAKVMVQRSLWEARPGPGAYYNPIAEHKRPFTNE